MDGYEEQDDTEGIFVAVAADEGVWLPEVRLGFPLTEDDESVEPILAMMRMTPETAYKVGAALLQSATVSAALYAELINKTVEERREVFALEQGLMAGPDPSLN